MDFWSIVPITVEQWIRFVTEGEPSTLGVTRLSGDLCRALGASTNLVQMRHDYTLKSAFKHKIEPYRFPMLQNTIDYGRAVLDHRRDSKRGTVIRLEKW